MALLWREWVIRWELSFTRTEVIWRREGVLLTITTRSIMRLVRSIRMGEGQGGFKKEEEEG